MLNKDTRIGEEELRSCRSCCIGSPLCSGEGPAERERERREDSWGRRAELLSDDRECPLVASADNSASASALLLREQSIGSAGAVSGRAQNGTLEETIRGRQGTWREGAHLHM